MGTEEKIAVDNVASADETAEEKYYRACELTKEILSIVKEEMIAKFRNEGKSFSITFTNGEKYRVFVECV